MTNQLLVMLIAAAAGCGVVTKPGPATGSDDDDDGSAIDPGEDAGMDAGSDAGSGSGSGSGSSHPDFPAHALVGSVQDERGDAIDFSTGEPVHTHAGAAIDLSSGCPAVYKYAYLTDAQPRYGRQLTANTLAWQVWSDAPDLDQTATAFRVRNAAGTVLQDWTSIAADAGGIYRIAIHRDATTGMAALGTYVGRMYVDARFRTTGGTETIDSACWDNHPLAAPLKIDPVAPGALFGMTLAANSPISPIINLGSTTSNAVGAEITTMPITQLTAEPTTITIGAQPTGIGTARVAQTYLAGFYQNTSLPCATATSGSCVGVPTPPVYFNKSGPLSGMWQLRIVDDQNNIVCRTAAATLSCTLPARAANQPPRAYRAVLSLANEPALQPPAVAVTETTFSETTVGGLHFTGSHASAYVVACLVASQVAIAGATPYNCTRQGDVYLSQVLLQAKIDFNAIPFSLTTGSGLAAMPPAYVDGSALSLSARTWDGGIEDISQTF